MARKKQDFRPDPSGSGILSKLYLTRKQRLSLLKWTLYALVCLVLLIIQDVITSRIPIFGATLDPVGCAILLICVLQGPESGGVFALSASAFYLFSGSAPGPYTIVLLTLYGIVAAVFRQAYLRKGLIAIVLCAFFAMMLYELSVFSIGIFLEYTIPERFFSFLLTGLYSLAIMPLLYTVLMPIGKIGGETWKE